ncbi:hypothetical protein [Comamonas sp.]|uniref:hypothetical protein n=1 Tax=Comamonas sp. TaxID=34028 RepID=UPI003A93D399
MTTYDTGNPLGSSDPRDLFDNSQNADDAVNGSGKTWVDRFGRTRVSMKGVEEAVPDAIAARDESQAARDASVLARDASVAAAGPLYPTEAAGRAAVANGETFKVQGGGNVAAYMYRRDSAAASTLLTSFPSVVAVDAVKENQLLDPKNYPAFVRYLSADAEATVRESYPATAAKRGQVYKAFKSIRLTGFDPAKPLKVRAIWNSRVVSGEPTFRLLIDEWSGSAWGTAFDSGSPSMASLGFNAAQVVAYKGTSGTKTIEAVIDLNLVPTAVGTLLNPAVGDPDLVIAPACHALTSTDTAPGIAAELAKFNANKPRFISRRKPTFSIIFDDLNTTDPLAYSVCADYGFKPGFALISSRFTTENIKLYQGYYLAGCSILAHGVQSLPMRPGDPITAAQVETEMRDSRLVIESNGMRVSGWVTPNSVLDEQWLPIAEKNFGYAFTRLNAGLFDSTVDPIRMARVSMEELVMEHNIAQAQARVDLAITNGENIVFYAHRVPSSRINSDATSMMSEAELRTVLAYVKSKADNGLCRIASPDEAISSYYQKPWS